ncbi:MAG: hypothetical protein E5V35_30850 [Mesorhizobium sp.]|nr:MAG: hypothetical protein E5V35_30850 [Mesorhizobium sp.]
MAKASAVNALSASRQERAVIDARISISSSSVDAGVCRQPTIAYIAAARNRPATDAAPAGTFAGLNRDLCPWWRGWIVDGG